MNAFPVEWSKLNMMPGCIRSPALKLVPAVAGLMLVAGADFRNPVGAAEAAFGVYKSLDQGAGWFEVGQGLPADARINALSRESGVTIAGTDRGVYWSRDDGTNWVSVQQGAGAETRVLCFTTEARRIFAGTQKHGVLVSDDAGKSWKGANVGLTDGWVRSILAVGSKLYAGTDRHGVFVSENAGASWTQQAAGLPDSSQVFDLASAEGTVFAGLYSKGLYRWEDQRGLWVKSGTVLPLELVAVGKSLVVGHNPGGIFLSLDQGKTWQDGNAGLPPNVPVWTLAADAQQVLLGASGKVGFAVDDAGLFTSLDRGGSWVRSDTGIPPGGAAISFLITREFVLAGISWRKS